MFTMVTIFNSLCTCINGSYYNEKKKENVSPSAMSDPLQPHGLQPTRLLCPWDSPGKNSGMGSHSLLQELNPGLLHCRQILLLSELPENVKCYAWFIGQDLICSTLF